MIKLMGFARQFLTEAQYLRATPRLPRDRVMPGGRLLSGLLCLAVLATVLTLGLSPFHVPANRVAWLKDRSGLEFGGDGSAMSAGFLPPPSSAEGSAGGLEIWLQPRRIWDHGTLLAFCSRDCLTQLLVRQSETGLEIETRQSGRWRARMAKLYVRDVFRTAKPVFVGISSSAHGTAVYVNGVLVETTTGFRPGGGHFAGRLIVSDAPGQTDNWRGWLLGLAVYHSELTPAQVARHYQTWTQAGRPAATADERAVALYLFDERRGDVAHNAAGPGFDLQIPARYGVVDKILLEPFWQEFNLSWSYWSSALKNIVGFVPLGFCFYIYLAGLGLKRPTLVTILLGTAVSVTIEVLQGYLPTRDSGTTDIFTNTLGTWIGVASYNLVRSILAKTLPLPNLATPPPALEYVTQARTESD